MLLNAHGGFWSGGNAVNGNDEYTKLLLHFDGADGSTTFTDSSASAHTVTPFADAQIDTAQSKFGGSSCVMDGNDYATLVDHADFQFGTGDFTIDFWFRINSGTLHYLYDGRPNGSNGLRPTLYYNSGLKYLTNAVDRITGSTLSTGVWYHIALARSGTDTKLFIDGTQTGSTYTDSNNYVGGTDRPIIGASGNPTGGGPLNGWLDEYRVSKGIARWTSNFTPPTGPYY